MTCHCGEAIPPRGTGYHRKPPTYCSRRCSGQARAQETALAKGFAWPARRAQRTARACTECGAEARPGALTCGVTCARARAARYERERNGRRKPITARRCRFCRQTFTPTYGDKRRNFCSRRCSGRLSKRAFGVTHRKRARLLCVPYEGVDRLKVFARDGWRCQLCKARTPKRLIGTLDPRAPELDHIIPMNRVTRGSHTYANVQLACRACNGAKGAKPLGQLRIA